MKKARERIYCAGPLFNDKEREDMESLSSALEQEGYSTFLPQRDGLELTRCVEHLVKMGFAADRANSLMSRAIFALDVYQVLYGCDALVSNLNGRVPDEGTVSEASMAWARGKVVVGYKSDSRTAFGGQDNPLVTGLFGFHLCQTITEVVSSLNEYLRLAEASQNKCLDRDVEISSYCRLGNDLWNALSTGANVEAVVEMIVSHGGAAEAV